MNETPPKPSSPSDLPGPLVPAGPTPTVGAKSPDYPDRMRGLNEALRGTIHEPLIDWARELAEDHARLAKENLRQRLEFATLFEIAGQISARSFDERRLLSYLTNTLRGHFAVSRVALFRPEDAEDTALQLVSPKGIKDVAALENLGLSLNGPLARVFEQNPAPLLLDQDSPRAEQVAELSVLRSSGLTVLLPLLMRSSGGAEQFEGLLAVGGRIGGNPFSDIDLKLLEMLGKMITICLHNEQLYRSSIVDDLTRVFSRGYFESMLTKEVSRINRYGKGNIALIMLDVDHFKRVNDEHGHPVGDLVLKDVAGLLVNAVRGADNVARYGGEEFAVILIEIDRDQALQVCERIRRSIEGHVVRAEPDIQVQVTASLGVACYPDDAGGRVELLNRADAALYRSKENGRNLVTPA